MNRDMVESTFIAEPQVKTPSIHFDSKTGVFEINGRSLPENPHQFYLPLFIWLEHYIENPAPKTTLNIQLEYFNSSSTKCIVEMFRKMEQISKNRKSEVSINWLYASDDEEMLESGENFKSILEVTFNLVPFNR